MATEGGGKSIQRTVWLVRHGERVDDVAADWALTAPRGNPFDPPLTETGATQAFETGARLAQEGITQVYSSPFLRCVQTAHHIIQGIRSARDHTTTDEPPMTIKVDTGFAEYMSTANFSSPPTYLTAPELLELLPEAPIDIDHSSLVTPRYPESESDMRSRCGLAITSLLACQSPGDTNIVIVTHGSPVSAILQALAEVRLRPAAVPYSSLTKVVEERPGEWQASSPLADTTHWRGG